MLAVWRSLLWVDFTLYPLQIRPWFLKEFCSWYLGLRVWFRLFALTSYGLGDLIASNRVVRLGSGLWWPTRSVFSGRPATEHGCRVVEVKPRITAGLSSQATLSHNAPSSSLALARSIPALSFRSLPLPSPSRSSRSSRQRCRRHCWPPCPPCIASCRFSATAAVPLQLHRSTAPPPPSTAATPPSP